MPRCLSSHQPMFKNHLPPSRKLFLPGTKSAQLHMPKRLPRRWSSVSASGPLPNELWKVPSRVYSVQIRRAWTGKLRTHGPGVSRNRGKRSNNPDHWACVAFGSSCFRLTCAVWSSALRRPHWAQGLITGLPHPMYPLNSQSPCPPRPESKLNCPVTSLNPAPWGD